MVNKSHGAAPGRRRLAPEARRQELLEAAERLLAAAGDRVRAEDVAAEAKTAKGTFFHYFPVWDDLLEAIRARVFVRFATMYEPPGRDAQRAAWAATLPALVRAFVEFTVGQGRLHEVLFHSDFARRRPLSREAGAIGRLERLVRDAQQAGAFVPAVPLLTAHFLFAVMHEAADLVSEGADREVAIGSAAALLQRALLTGETQ